MRHARFHIILYRIKIAINVEIIYICRYQVYLHIIIILHTGPLAGHNSYHRYRTADADGDYTVFIFILL